MGISWKFCSTCYFIFLFNLCYGLPLHLEAAVNDTHLQILTGLLAVILALCGVLLLAGCLCCQNRNGFKEFRDSPVIASTISNLDEGYVNPMSNGEFTIFGPLSPSPSTLQQNNNIFNSSEKVATHINYQYGNLNVTSWFGDDQINFPRNRLKYIRQLGKGWFGQVVEGTAQDIENDEWVPVAVRILESTASLKEKVFFLHEAEMYRCDEHTNILNLYGRCLEASPFLLLQEFCPQGDLKSYLISNQATAKNLLASEYPLIWCCQLTSALKHLHERNLCHQDLACRNCQLTSNLTLKLGDYGLAPSKYPEDYYGASSAISIRWCSPESIKHTNSTIISETITKQANIWSLGVCFWEICECGQTPYANLTDDDVVTQVLGSNVRLPMPSCRILYMDYIFGLMSSCWSTSESRPIVSQVYQEVTNLLQVYTSCQQQASNETNQDLFDIRWNALRPKVAVQQDNVSDYSILSVENQERFVEKPLSPSLSNLHGSFDNLHNVIEKQSETTNPSQKLQFMLDVSESDPLDIENQVDSLNDSSLCHKLDRASSSDTEEENWKLKVERGAYSEQVRQKSRSVTDLMVLTHIDYSESESETPLPSLDYRVNYKNVRCIPKNNLESMSQVHGSEGNLIEVKESFHDELKQLYKGHLYGSPVVPEKFSQNFSVRKDKSDKNDMLDLASSSSDNLLQEYSSSSQKVKQQFDVYTVAVNNNRSPLHVTELSKIINLERGDFINNDFNKFSKTNRTSFDSENEKLMMRESLKRSDDSGILLSSSERSGSPNTDDLEEHIKLSTEDFDSNEVSKSKQEYLILKTGALEHLKSDIHVLKDLKTDVDEVIRQKLNTCMSLVNEKEKNIEIANDKNDLPICHDLILNNGVIDFNKLPSQDCNIADEIIEERPTKLPILTLKESTEQNVEFKNMVINYPTVEQPIIENIADATPDKENFEDKYGCENTNSWKDNDIPLNDNFPNKGSENKSTKEGILTEYEKNESLPEKSPAYMPVKEVILIESEKNRNSLEKSPEHMSAEEVETEKIKISLEKSPEHIDVKQSILTDTEKKKVDKKSEKIKRHLYQVPKLVNLIENNDDLMNYIISHYESELPDDLSCENSLSVQESTPKCITKMELSTEVLPVSFDLSENQEATMPNSLTHVGIFSKQAKSLTEMHHEDDFSLNLVTDTNSSKDDVGEIPYSLETWDTFLGTSLHYNQNYQSDIFESVNSEPRSLFYVESPDSRSLNTPPNSDELSSDQRVEDFEDIHNTTFTLESKEDSFDDDDLDNDEHNRTFDVEEASGTANIPIIDDTLGDCENGKWESSEGWYLHPQSEKSLSGVMMPQEKDDDGAVGFGIDEDLMAAIRNELIIKLPHAQNAANNKVEDDEELNNEDKNEIFLQYNIRSFLPTIYEEEEDNYVSSEEEEDVSNESRSSSPNYLSAVHQKEDSHSLMAFESALKESQNSKSSQNSNGSNDTLFDLEELNGNLVEQENKNSGGNSKTFIVSDVENKEVANVACKSMENKTYLYEFLRQERECCLPILHQNSDNALQLLQEIKPTEETLLQNTPEQNLSQKSESLNKIEDINIISSTEKNEINVEDDENVDNIYEYVSAEDTKKNLDSINNIDYVNDIQPNDEKTINTSEDQTYSNIRSINNEMVQIDYVNVDESNQLEVPDLERNIESELIPDYVNSLQNQVKEELMEKENDDFLGVLSDIRFTGPGDELMSTSFNDECNDINDNDDQDWESGSESRSSSSGEFIWKEGEHEESLKALTALPQDSLDDVKTMEKIQEESASDSSCSEDEGDTTEFIPSAWDQYAIPMKSALRSPEKTLEKTDKKTRGVWFKKQRYHCVYEYPREPESPILQNFEQWKNSSLSSDWFFNLDSVSDDCTKDSPYNLSYESGFSSEFFIGGPSRPLDVLNSGCQFFPGSDTWSDIKLKENVTPDSGLEDSTPGSLSEFDSTNQEIKIPTLKQLASVVCNKMKQKEIKSNEILGGLRHTIDKLKLDLPPSPSPYSVSKSFSLDNVTEPIVLREKPSFSTFGKSRFLVQHVDTPEENEKNVCFEALPYKPIEKVQESSINRKLKEERGEANLLDSADEDSGIESSTLERRLIIS